MTKKQILKLRPEFKLGMGMTMIDWFEITEGAGFSALEVDLDTLTEKLNHHTIMKIVLVVKMQKKLQWRSLINGGLL